MKKTKQIKLKITNEIYKTLDEQSKQNNTSMSKMIIDIITNNKLQKRDVITTWNTQEDIKYINLRVDEIEYTIIKKLNEYSIIAVLERVLNISTSKARKEQRITNKNQINDYYKMIVSISKMTNREIPKDTINQMQEFYNQNKDLTKPY